MAAPYRRGTVWWGRVTRHGKEYRRSLGTTDRRIAEKRLQQWIEELEGLKWGDMPRRAWKDVWQRFMREHFPTIKPSSARRYADSLKQLSRLLDGRCIQDVSRGLLSEFETMRRADGVTGSSIRRDLTCLSLVLSYCEEWEWLPEGANIVPAYLRRRARRGLRESSPRTRYLSEAEEAALLAACNEPCRTAVILSVDTGLRDQELLGLTWGQVDLKHGTITTTTRTKNGKARQIPLLARSAQILAQLGKVKKLGGAYVLSRDDGSRYGRLNKAFEGACRRAGIGDLRWHDLRRTAGCRWLQREGWSMDTVSMLLGHSSIAVTESRYAFLDSEATAQKLAQGKRSA